MRDPGVALDSGGGRDRPCERPARALRSARAHRAAGRRRGLRRAHPSRRGHRRHGRRPRRDARDPARPTSAGRSSSASTSTTGIPPFRAANDRRSRTRPPPDELLPFVRLDLDESPIEEATRCIDLGARESSSIRAPSGSSGRPSARAGLCARRRAPRTDPHPRRPRPAADRRLARAAARSPHTAGADRRARGDRRPGGDGPELRRPSRRLLRHLVWSPLDVLDLYRLVPPEQVVYASDYPYGRQPNSLLLRGADRTGVRPRRRPGARPPARHRRADR